MTLEGPVEARNDHGIKLNGEWVNLSKFGTRPELPEVGAHVRAEVDNKGFLKSIDVLEQSATSAREQTIARLTVLKAAAHFAAGRADIKSGDVLRIAEAWLTWIEHED